MRTIIYILALMPLLYMSFRYSLGLGWHFPEIIQKFLNHYLYLHIGGHPANLVKFLQDATAKTALNLFIITLAIKPLHSYLKFDLLKYRRLIGLFGFFYLFLHVSVFVWLKHHLDLSSAYHAMIEHTFILFGFAAFLIFGMMAVTSIPFLFKRFASWHKLFYPAMVLVIVHFLLAQKHISLTDIAYVAVIASLLALKLLKR